MLHVGRHRPGASERGALAEIAYEVLIMKSSDKDLLRYIALAAISVGIMLGAIRLLGEVHGLVATVIGLLVTISHLSIRLGAVQREVQCMRKTSEAERSPAVGGTQ